MIGRYVPIKVRRRTNLWSRRKARWRRWRKFGVDWSHLERKLKIIEIMRSRRCQNNSNQKCKNNDAKKRPVRILKVKNLKIQKQTGICVNPRLTEANGKAKMFKHCVKKFNLKPQGSSDKISSVTQNCNINTSPDLVTLFFFPFKNCGKVTSRKKYKKKLKLSKEDLLGIAISDFFYYLRRSRKLKKKKIRNGERGSRHSRNIFYDVKKSKNSELRVRKTRKKKKPGIKTARVFVKQKGPVHRGPQYNISLEEVSKKYNQMRKGKGFYASKKVLWRNRHALVLGSSNFYRKGKADENLKVDNKEYDVVEPPEPYDDPVVPTTGAGFPSDPGYDGPVKRKFNCEKKKGENYQKGKGGSNDVGQVKTSHNLQMSQSSHGRGGNTQQEQTSVPKIDFPEILQSTAHRRKRVQVVRSNSPQVHNRHDREQRMYYSARAHDFLISSGLTTDTVLWEYMCKVGKDLAETALLDIFSDFDGRVRTKETNRKINNLEKLISEGSTDPMILKLWKVQLEAKKKELVEHQGIVPGTPESSDDEDEEDDEHDSTFCAIEPQKKYCIVSPNERTNQNLYDPPTQQMVPRKLITNAKAHEKSRSSKGRGVRTQQEQMNYPILRKTDKQIKGTQQIVRRTLQFNARSNSNHTTRVKQNYMENESFLSRYSYGGGKRRKRKSKDSDKEYDPNYVKKQKRKKLD